MRTTDEPGTPRESPAPRRARGIAVTILLMGASFLWGLLTHRSKIFPFALLRRAAVAAGIPVWDPSAPPRAKDENVLSPAVAALRNLPYASGQYDPNAARRNVIVNVPGRVAPGLNFYSTVADGRAYLVDNDGRPRWRWSVDRREFEGALKPLGFAYPRLFANGDVLALAQDGPLVKLDRSSRLLWKYPGPIHHDAWVCPDGTIYALQHRMLPLPEIESRLPALLDEIVVLSPDGRRQREISLYDLFRKSRYAFLLPRTAGMPLSRGTKAVDVFHANRVQVLDGSQGDGSSLYRRGNILVSLRNLNAVALLDGATLEILWLWGPTNLTFQHHPSMLSTGNVLIFDNGATRSSVVEVDPRRDIVAWRYAPPAGFFSATRGACQRLPNGNTLVTESQTGYAFEVTPSLDVVWKFANPAVDSAGKRQAIYRMSRLPESELAFLGEPPPAPSLP